MSKSHPRFVIVPHSPGQGWRRGLLSLAWLGSLLLTAALVYHYAVPAAARHAAALAEARQQLAAQQLELQDERQRNAVLRRSEQVSRDALAQLQTDLASRDEEIAGLRADVSFYERLVGGEAQRKGLTVHSVEFSEPAGGAVHFTVTLTQNLKKTGLVRGDLRLAIEGVVGGQLQTLEWSELQQNAEAAGLAFGFRYFQKVEGSVMLPAGFQPHRVQVQVSRDGSRFEHAVPWEATRKPQGT